VSKTADPYFLSKGSHTSPDEGRCAMEWVAYLAGEPHSDQPVCVSPALRSFGIAFNDRLPDDKRQKLRPYLARCIGTAGDGRDEERGRMCIDWLIRTASPNILLAGGLEDDAARLLELPSVLAVENVDRVFAIAAEARRLTRCARNEAQARLAEKLKAAGAAGAAGAAWAAGAAGAAAAAWAAGAAGAAEAAEAAGAAGAAWAAFRQRFREIVEEKLSPTFDELFVSGLELFDRMLPTEPLELPVVADAEAVCAAA
jgi:hypothetical protein